MLLRGQAGASTHAVVDHYTSITGTCREYKERLVQMDLRDSSREYLNELDRRTALDHLHHAAEDTVLAAHRFGDIVRRDGEDVWDRFDRTMEDSRWPGGGPERHAADFTEVGLVLLTQGTKRDLRLRHVIPVGWDEEARGRCGRSCRVIFCPNGDESLIVARAVPRSGRGSHEPEVANPAEFDRKSRPCS